MKENHGYAGAIKNSGVQQVKAPFSSNEKGKSRIKRGNDLRSEQDK